ncbi:MAG: hypothetical protein ACI31R_05505 [Bacilli bacterium]
MIDISEYYGGTYPDYEDTYEQEFEEEYELDYADEYHELEMLGEIE